MLCVTVPKAEYYDELRNEFIYYQSFKLRLEHSLVSVSKWESKWNKPFFTKEDKTREESIDYIRCMTITQNVPDHVYERVTDDILDQVNEYIDAPMTATTIRKDKRGAINRDVITSEVMYYWMITLGIPFECQKWHLNRLIMLINVCNAKNAPKKKMSQRELLARNRSLNEMRKAKMRTKG